MKHLKTFSLYESSATKADLSALYSELSDAVWNELMSRISLKELYDKDPIAWINVSHGADYDSYAEEYSDSRASDANPQKGMLEEWEYDNYERSYDGGYFDDFMAILLGLVAVEFEEDMESPIRWYMREYDVTSGVAAMMRYLAVEGDDESNLLDILIHGIGEFPNLYPLFMRILDALIDEWDLSKMAKIRRESPDLWKEVKKRIDSEGSEVSADLGELGF